MTHIGDLVVERLSRPLTFDLQCTLNVWTLTQYHITNHFMALDSHDKHVSL